MTNRFNYSDLDLLMDCGIKLSSACVKYVNDASVPDVEYGKRDLRRVARGWRQVCLDIIRRVVENHEKSTVTYVTGETMTLEQVADSLSEDAWHLYDEYFNNEVLCIPENCSPEERILKAIFGQPTR